MDLLKNTKGLILEIILLKIVNKYRKFNFRYFDFIFFLIHHKR